MNHENIPDVMDELLRYRTALAEARARVETLEKYIVDQLLAKVKNENP